MEDREMPQMHKYGENKMTGKCTSHHCPSRMYEITGHLILVEQSVHNFEQVP